MPKPDDLSYDVGYGKPPVATQFKKGQSGNPAGRPKGKRNLASALDEALNAKVVVTENGRRTTRSKLEVALTQVVNKAANGDLRALGMVLQLAPLLDQQDTTTSPDLAADRALARQIATRLAARLASQPNTSPDTPDAQGDAHEPE